MPAAAVEPAPAADAEVDAEVDSDSATDGAGQTEFDVVLTQVGTDRIAVIKLVRELTGLGLKDVSDLVDATPGAVIQGSTLDEAELMEAALEEQGATVEIE